MGERMGGGLLLWLQARRKKAMTPDAQQSIYLQMMQCIYVCPVTACGMQDCACCVAAKAMT